MCGQWLIGSTVLADFFSFLFSFAKDSVLLTLNKSIFLTFWLRRLTSISQFPDRRCSPPSARWISIVAFTLLFLCAGCSCKVPETTKEQETTLQAANPVKRIQLNIEPAERSVEAILQSAIPARRILDWLKSGILQRETNCPEGVSLCSTSQTCCRIFNVFFLWHICREKKK